MAGTSFPNPPAVSRRRGLLMVGAAAALWGTSGLTATVAYSRGVHPLTVSSWRMAIGAIALSLLLRRSRRTGVRPTLADGRRLVLIGASLGAYQACYFLAVQRAGVSIATLLTLGLAPVLVTIGERLLTRRPTAPATVAGIALAIAGLAALVGVPSGRSPDLLTGALLATGSAFGYATLTLAGGTLSTRLGAQRLTRLAFVIAAVLLVPVTATTVGLGLGPDPVVPLAMLYLGVVPTALAYRWFFAGLQRVPASVAAVLVLLEPLVATALAVPLLGERLTVLGWTGAGSMIVAVVLVSTPGARLTRRRPTLAPTTPEGREPGPGRDDAGRHRGRPPGARPRWRGGRRPPRRPRADRYR
jgi:drug/metabolite transporter, DME family